MDTQTTTTSPRRWLALFAALALIISACASTGDSADGATTTTTAETADVLNTIAAETSFDNETATAEAAETGTTADAQLADGAGSNLGPTSDELNTIAVVERFGPSTAALAVSVGGQRTIDGVVVPADGPVRGSSGSGFVIDVDGERFIVTNFHVVEATLIPNTSTVRDDATIEAVFGEAGSLETSLDVVGVNPSFDLALLQATNGDEIPAVEPIPIADSDEVVLGQKTVAIGNPFGLGATVTTGIVSSTERFIESIGRVDIPVLQTDAAINPGNSGGALLNSSGELIGINTAIFAPGQTAASAGIGFAVPSNLLVESLVNLEDGGVSMLSDTRPALDAQLGNIAGLPPQVRAEAGLPDSGIAVLDVEPGGAADLAGLRVPEFLSINGIPIPIDPDIILAVDGEPVETSDELNEEISFGDNDGESVTITILRDGAELDLVVSLT